MASCLQFVVDGVETDGLLDGSLMKGPGVLRMGISESTWICRDLGLPEHYVYR